MTKVTRRTALGFLGAVAIPSAAVATLSATTVPKMIPVDEFLTINTPAERVLYHAQALAEAMEEVQPGRSFRTQIDHDGAFCFIAARTSRTLI